MQAGGRATLILFVLFQALYGLTSSGNAFRVPDEFEVYFQAEHLVDVGDLSVPQTLGIRMRGDQPIFFGRIGLDGKPYAPYGPLAAILALPQHLVARFVTSLTKVQRSPLPDGLAWVLLVSGLTMIASATASALAVAGFHCAALAIGTPPRTALTLSLLLGGATILWPYGTTFYSEAWQAAAFIWAAALLLDARRRTSRAALYVVFASALLGMAGLTKVTSLVFAPGFVIAALCDRSLPWRTRVQVAVALSTGIAAAAAIQIGWNVHRFGQAFEFGYNWSEAIPELPPRLFLLTELPHGLQVLLLSPGKSIFVWAPALVLSLVRARRFARMEPAIAAGVAVSAAVGLLFFAAYLFPEGGYANGPRQLVPIVPLLLLPAAGRDSRWSRGAVTACAAIGAVIAMLAVSVSFLEDQSLGADLGGGARTTYYDRIRPAPGRPWNSYRADFIPFVSALTVPGWLHAERLGQGPDFFPLHLLQARRQLPNGDQIPLWLVWSLPIFWLTIVSAAVVALVQYGRETVTLPDRRRKRRGGVSRVT
ncbi:MAG TPA: hypothetical protein VGH34_10480 [Vicinamibacterales bacterium]|jgi:hypothetical protein